MPVWKAVVNIAVLSFGRFRQMFAEMSPYIMVFLFKQRFLTENFANLHTTTARFRALGPLLYRPPVQHHRKLKKKL